MKTLKRSIALALCIILTLYTAVSAEDFSSADTARYLVCEVSEPQFGSEWVITGLACGGAELPEGYIEGYISRAEEYVKSCGGILGENKYTEYSRAVIALTAAGADPRSFAGYDLTAPLCDSDKVSRQGINGVAYALMALESGDYAGERDGYINRILVRQLSSGGFSFAGDEPDADMTAIALQALAPFTDRADVAAAVDAALACLSKMQDEDGGFYDWSSKSSESCAQVLLALCALKIDINDSRFVKNGRTVLDALMEYKTPSGGFSHNLGEEASVMSSEQAYLAITSYERTKNGEVSVYDTDSTKLNVVINPLAAVVLFSIFGILR